MDGATPRRTATTKRKAEEESEKTADNNKKAKPTFTPRTQGGKALKRTNIQNNTTPKARTPTTGRRMAAVNEDDNGPAPTNSKPEWLDGLSIALAKSLTTTLTATLTERLSEDFRETLRGVNKRVDKNSASISEIRGTIERMERRGRDAEKRADERMNEIVGAVKSGSQTSNNEGTAQDDDGKWTVDKRVRAENLVKSEKYEEARRSLRLWPVAGEDQATIWKEALRFIHQKMCVRVEDCPKEKIRIIRRARPARRSIVGHEVIVSFWDRTTRDIVATHSKNLYDFKDDSGMPTAGTRLEYPSHLGQTFRNLDW